MPSRFPKSANYGGLPTLGACGPVFKMFEQLRERSDTPLRLGHVSRYAHFYANLSGVRRRDLLRQLAHDPPPDATEIRQFVAH